MSEAVDFVSLLVIVALAAVCPLIADRIPKHIIPETVFLLIVGAAFGPYGFAPVINIDDTISFLSELGCAFLFLLAGYEIEPDMLMGKQGRRGLATWVVSFAIAAAAIWLMPGEQFGDMGGWALAIMFTTTAIGTLMPILSERKLLGTPLGNAIISYGTWGELGPVVAIVILLSARATWQSALILLALVLLCVLLAVRGKRARESGSRLFRVLVEKANTTSQTLVRFTLLLLVLLITVSALFDMDIVIGAFAAGFVLRYIVPEGNETLELKLNGIGYGFFIPLFFICSGAKIDVASVASQPVMLLLFIVGLLVIRAVPIFVAMRIDKSEPRLSARACASTAVYCTTALPLIVAASNIAVNAGAMSQSFASVLVAAGAVTVFLMPLIGQAAFNVADAQEMQGLACEEPEAVHEEPETEPEAEKRPKPAPSPEAPAPRPAPAVLTPNLAELAAARRRAMGLAHAATSHATPFAFRLAVERMINHGVPSHDVALYIANHLGFPEDAERIRRVEDFVTEFRNRHNREGALY